ncbi:hypothetical protein [Hymenobacter rigui]|uniref:Uncharacterized protein n=1 Tax=Hymenobacter rigui TaxID=334424 RepID=A0A428KWT2_9BACT|nr:hypothetical protein [Hymenobacter rigui]RSK51226.1 hypothetical protein EI291_02635 [Hymenobacter rigui]
MKEELIALSAMRKQVPVEMREGLRLLAETKGDVPAAVERFKAERLALVVEKTGADVSLCLHCLKVNHFDIRQTLIQIENSKYSVSERILCKCTQNGQALSDIALVVEQAAQLQRKYWFRVTDLAGLNRPQYALLLIQEWTTYEEWESFPAALSFEMEAVLEVFEQELELPAVAANLRAANQRYQQVRLTTSYREALRQKGYAPADPELQQYEDVYQGQRVLIDEKLSEYVRAHITSFP